jgi:hypothetical protein
MTSILTSWRMIIAALAFGLGSSLAWWNHPTRHHEPTAKPAPGLAAASITSAPLTQVSSTVAVDPLRALTTALGTHDERALWKAFNEASDSDPEACLRLLVDASLPEKLHGMYHTCLVKLFRINPEAAISALRASSVLQRLDLVDVLSDLAKLNGRFAIDLWQQHRDLFRATHLERLAAGWASSDPEACANYGVAMQNLDIRQTFLKGALEAWVTKDFAAFLNWAKQQGDGIQSVLEQVRLPDTLKSFDQLLTLAEVLPFESFSGSQWLKLARAEALKPGGMERTRSLAMKFQDAEMREATLAALVKSACDMGDMQKAREIWKNLALDEFRSGSGSYIAASLALTDVPAAMGFAKTLTSPQDREDAFSSVLLTTARLSTLEATRLVRDHWRAFPVDTLSSFVQQWLHVAPSEALAWVSSLADAKVKAAMYDDVAYRLASDKPDVALKWVQTQPPGDSRDALLNHLISGRVNTSWPDYAGAMKLVSKITSPQKRQERAIELYRSWSRLDESKAAKWLASAEANLALGAVGVATVRKPDEKSDEGEIRSFKQWWLRGSQIDIEPQF